MLFPVPQIQALAALNAQLAPHSRALSPAQAAALQKRESEALSHTGRVCFGESIVPCLARAFAPSLRIQACDWADTLGELTAIFYALKRETQDRIADDALIARMVRAFDGPAQGSLTLLVDSFFMQEADDE